MFDDVSEDHALAGDINCIAYYGVTLGMGDGTYAPDANVSAFEMRLFVERAAERMGADGEAVLGGVMLSDPVTRLEMAQLMFGLVDNIDDDVRINPADGQIQFYDDTNTWVVVDDFFADAKAQVPIFESQLVGATYELGIVFGRSANVSTADSVFAPSDPVSRAEMAAFIARTLDHSDLRPEGLSFQHNSAGDSMISLRDGDFEPMADARIDVFSALYADDAFDPDDGECELRFVRDETPSHSTCQIDIGDQLTDDQGNIEFTPVSLGGDPITAACGTDGSFRFSTASGSAGRSYWAWYGSLGDEVDEDTTLADLENVARPVGTAGPDYARISGGLPTGDEIAKMGETVTFTVQLRSDTGSNGRDGASLVNDVAAGPDRNRNPYTLRVEKYFLARVTGTDSDYGDAEETRTGTASVANGLFENAPGDWNLADASGATVAAALSRFQTPVDTVVWPNADGAFDIVLTNPDLDAANDGTDVGVRFTLAPFTQANDLIKENLVTSIVADGNAYDSSVLPAGTTLPTGTTTTTDIATGYVVFSDDPLDPHKVAGESASYRIIAGSRTGNSVTVSVLDQYGDPMRNIEVSVTSDLDGATPTVDQVVYPEEVDTTVQVGEDPDGDDSDNDLAPSDPLVSGTASPARHFRTRSNGAYLIGYNYINPSHAQTEAITPKSVQLESPGTGGGANTVTRAAETGDAVTVYWANIGTSGASTASDNSSPGFVNLLVADVASRTIVANEPTRDSATPPATDASGDNPMAYFYDEDDTFIISNVGATFEMFEEVLSLSLAAGDSCEVNMISWENYTLNRRDLNPNRPGRVDRTIWEVTLSTS